MKLHDDIDKKILEFSIDKKTDGCYILYRQ